MCEYTIRTALLLGEAAMKRLAGARVAVVGLGGVGAACAEALARCGVGTLIAMDHDKIDPTNLNRQLFATAHTIGRPKTEAARERLLDAAPGLSLILLPVFYGEESKEPLFAERPDLVVDAIDTVSSKLSLAAECQARSIPILSCMGTGNRLDPTQFRLGILEETGGCGCPLARVMRRECKKRGISGLPVLYSAEQPRPVAAESAGGRHSPASVSYCPPAAGYAMASWAVRKLTGA